MVPNPNKRQVKGWLAKWDSLENYAYQESSLTKLFTKTYPINIDMDDVLIKVCALNDFYSTNIFSPFMVAKHIVTLDIDKSLKNDDLELVNRIARVNVGKGKVKNFYSFASKYCSHHKPLTYPIYDSYVEKILLHFNKRDNFSNFKKDDLKDYKKFLNALSDFQKFYKLDDYSLKELDKYLWQLGKEYFPKKY